MSAPQTTVRTDISCRSAIDLAQAAIDAAELKSLRICAVVADSGGSIVALMRMDGVNDLISPPSSVEC